MSAPLRRVLVVSFDFPPRRTSAVYRMIGLTRSLPQLGWQPTVLTIRNGGGGEEPGLLDKLPGEVGVVRTSYPDLMRWEDNVAKWVSPPAADRNGHSNGAGSTKRAESLGVLHCAAELFRSTFYFPDHTVGWIPFGLMRALQLHRRQHWDLVYTTSPPRAAPVIGLLLKELCGVPWVLEFMDPWYPANGRLRRRAEDKAQQLLLRKADQIVVMMEGHARELERRFNCPAHKLKIVRNGFFEEDFALPDITGPPALEPGYIHLCHFGTIYPGNDGLFFPALAELLRENPAERRRLRLHLVGAASREAIQRAKDCGLADILQVHGFVQERSRVLQMMRESHCLLLFWGRPDFSRMAIAGKTYDYLRTGRPILGITHEGGVQELIEGGQAGWVARPDDVNAINRALRAALAAQPKADERAGESEFVAQFRWDRQAEILAGAFEEATEYAR